MASSNADHQALDRVSSSSTTTATTKIEQQQQPHSSGPATTGPMSRSAPTSRPSQLAAFGMTSANTVPRPPSGPGLLHVKSKSVSKDLSTQGRRAMALAALPSFSHNLSDFDKMPVVPGELLTGCLRTDTNAICQAKLANVLAANNKVFAPYSSSSEDELSYSSDSSSCLTVRRRTGLGGSSAGLNSRGLVIDPLASVPSRPAADTPPALASSHTDSDSSPGLIPTPGFPSGVNSVIHGNSARVNPYFPTTSQDPESSSDDLPPMSGGVSMSREATIRQSRRHTDRNSSSSSVRVSRSISTVRSQSKSRPRSRNGTPHATRSPERDRTSGTSPTIGQRECEAALFKAALERTGRRARPHVRATFELSTDEESDDE